jgi:endonuclease/exonuclease/phosphatase family metal-dependent hydrolase
MFRTLRSLVTLGALVVGGGWVYQKNPDLVNRFLGFFKSGSAAAPTPVAGSLPAVRPGPVIRIASFNIEVFGEKKFENKQVVDVLAKIVRMFDVVAVQEVRAMDPTLISRFVQQVNASGAQYDFVLGPRLGNTNIKEQYVFIYDQTRIEIDRTSAYTVRDPDNLLHREPLVCGFRARAAPPEQAFTFTLVNVHTDPDDVDDECNALASAYQMVRNDGRGEDDIIMLGDFNADDRKMGRIVLLPNIFCVIPSNIHTNTVNTKTLDNIVFDRRATSEFLGGIENNRYYGFGVLDIMREFNLTLDQANLVSDHLPIWAEFSIYEGGAPGPMAAAPGPVGR